MSDIWAELQREPPLTAMVSGIELRRGSRVRLNPGARGDIFDQALTGRVGIIEGFDEGLDGEMQVAVTLQDDPGRDMGEGRYPGHRFFFALTEVEPVDIDTVDVTGALVPPVRGPRVLVAGIGNMFLGDDGFGVAVARELTAMSWPPGVDVRDFGIRAMDLAYALQNEYDAVLFIDAAPRGAAPGTLFLIDAAVDADGPMSVDPHGMNPVKVLALARSLGRVPARVIVLGCEPVKIIAGEAWDEMDMTLSPEIEAVVPIAVERAGAVIRALVNEKTLDGILE